MEMKKNKIFVNNSAAEVNSSVMTECETIVPDTKPDLLKILQLDADAKVISYDISDGKINMSIEVNYKILYVPESAKGICSLEATAAAVHTEEINGITADMYCELVPDVEHIEFNLINSRKLAIKSVIGVQCRVMEKLSLEIPEEISGEDIETRQKNVRALNRTVNKNTEIAVDDQLIIAPGKPAIDTMLKNDVSVRNKEIKIIAGKVVAKGEIVVCTLYLPVQSENVMSVEHTLPFTEILDAEGILEENYNNIDFKITKSEFSPVPDSDGDIRAIDCSVRINVHITSDEIIECSVITDAYSTAGNLVVKSSYFEVEEMTESLETTSTIKENIVPAEGIPPILHVYNVVAKPYVTGVLAEGGKVSVEGIIDTYILYISPKEDSPVYSFKEEVPFSLNIETGKIDTDNIIKVKTETNHISYNLNAAGEIELRIVLKNQITAYKMQGIDVINSIEEKEYDASDTPSIVLYFVQNNDTLWDIAKRYHTKATYIEELNELSGGQLKTGQQLLIPKG